jgi:cell division protein FtsB
VVGACEDATVPTDARLAEPAQAPAEGLFEGADGVEHTDVPANRSWVLSARSGAVLGVVVVLMMTLALPAKAFITQRSRIAQLESQLAWHTQRSADLAAAHKRWEDPAYIEAQARARLHYVRPGQVGYVVLTDIAPSESETTTTRPQAELPAGGPWWSALWGTVEGVAKPTSKNTAPPAPEPAKPAPSYGG